MASGVMHSFVETLYTQQSAVSVATGAKGLCYLENPIALSATSTAECVGMSRTQVGNSLDSGAQIELEVNAYSDLPINAGREVGAIVLTLNPAYSDGVDQAPGNFIGTPMVTWDNLIGMPYIVKTSETYVIWFQNIIWGVYT